MRSSPVKSRILLHLDHAANRRLLAEALGARHEIIATGADDTLDLAFDLCVVDGPALDRLWERVRARRAAEQPHFLPFLLVVSRQDVGMATRYLWQTVDELIFSPIQKVELQARVENLLNARRLSVELERRVAEHTAALHASETRLRAILDTEPECVKLLAADGSLLNINPAGLRILAADSFEQVAGQCVYPLVVAEHREAFRRLVEGVFAGQPGALEFEIINLKGERRWLETHATPLRDPAGAVTALLGVTRDITERKPAEMALRESEHLLAESQRIAHIGSWVLDLTGRHRWSDETYRLFGVPPDTITLTTEAFLNLIHADDRPAMQAWIAACVAREHPGELEFRIIRPDGTTRWMSGQGELMCDDTGRPTHIAGTVQDITERKRAEERLRRLNRTYEMLSQINQLIVRERDPQAILERACRIAVDNGGFKLAWIGLRASAGELLKLVAQAGATPDTLAILDHLFGDPQQGCTFTDRALETGRHAVCNDIARDPLAAAWRAAALERGYRAMVALPVTVAGQPVGTFNLYASDAEFFDAEELRLLDELAADIGFALENSQRETERRAGEERLARQRAALIELTSQGAIEGLDLLAALRRITETAARTLDVARVGIWRFNREHSAIECVDLFEAATQRHSAGAVLTAATHPAYFRALAEVEVLAADDAIRDPRTSELAEDYLRPLGIQSVLDVPIHTGGQLSGVLCHEHAGSLRPWTADEKTFAVAMANLVSLAVEGWERRQAESALRESEARFREIAETIEEVFWVADPAKNRVLYVSPAYEKIWGRTCASLYESARPWLEAIHPDDRERVRLAAETQQTSGGYDETYRILRPDGAVRWIRDVAFPVRNESGDVVRIVGVARDITERRQLEEQLRLSQKMEAIGLLAGGVAHDFNNILAAILMQAELIGMAEDVSEEVHDGLQQIRAAAERGANLTRQLLLFSRKQVMQPRDLDLNDVVTSLARMLQRIIGEDVHLQLNLHPRPLLTRADAGMLDQLLLNLVVNARDAMPKGGRLVIETCAKDVTAAEAALTPDASAGRYVCLRVSDTGCGIAPEDLGRIFEPFFTTKEPGKGTGLGLATVFGIVKQHGGWIAVESAVGQGTTFQVFLPAVEAAASGAAASTQPAPRGGTETILLVEDDPGVRTLTRRVLEGAGYRVLEAANGVEALAIGERHRGEIDLLFTDIVMPGGISGRELAARLQATHPTLRVVFTSGYSAEIAGRELALQPGQNFIQKPAAPRELLETIRRCLDSPPGGPLVPSAG